MSLPKTFSMKSVKGDIDVPVVGFGTGASGDTNWCYKATLAALQAGYRHVDCAWLYAVCPIAPEASPYKSICYPIPIFPLRSIPDFSSYAASSTGRRSSRSRDPGLESASGGNLHHVQILAELRCAR